MKRTKFISRVVFLLLAVILLVYINQKTDDNTRSIAEFKIKMLNEVRKDSLDTKHKLDLLVNETSKFIDDSSRVREGIHYLVGLLGLWVAVELGLLMAGKRS